MLTPHNKMGLQKEKITTYLSCLGLFLPNVRPILTYWGAVLTAAYMINRVHLMLVLFSLRSHIYFLMHIMQSLKSWVFGCVAFVNIDKQRCTELDSSPVIRVFMGYTPNKRVYKSYNPSGRKYFVFMDVAFF